MLEAIALSFLVALGTSLSVSFASRWTERRMWINLEGRICDLEEGLLSEKRKRAAQASVAARAARPAIGDTDLEIMKSLTARPSEDEPWWASLTGSKRDS